MTDTRDTNHLKRKSLEDDKKEVPRMKMKFSIGNSKLVKSGPSKPTIKAAPLKISLSKPLQKETESRLVAKSEKVAAVFNPDEESDDEEMPMEAKMRMKNVGKDTPTACGPNSFGKSKKGFSQDYKIYERKLMETVGDPDKERNNKSNTNK